MAEIRCASCELLLGESASTDALISIVCPLCLDMRSLVKACVTGTEYVISDTIKTWYRATETAYRNNEKCLASFNHWWDANPLGMEFSL